jgi:hypothetical protein
MIHVFQNARIFNVHVAGAGDVLMDNLPGLGGGRQGEESGDDTGGKQDGVAAPIVVARNDEIVSEPELFYHAANGGSLHAGVINRQKEDAVRRRQSAQAALQGAELAQLMLFVDYKIGLRGSLQSRAYDLWFMAKHHGYRRAPRRQNSNQAIEKSLAAKG